MTRQPESPIRPLTEDEVHAATIFDPELTYYADGTRVRMTVGDKREGVCVGVKDAHPYAYQAVRWRDGGTSNVAPQALERLTDG